MLGTNYFHHVVFTIGFALHQVHSPEIPTSDIPQVSIHMMLHSWATLTIIYINIIIHPSSSRHGLHHRLTTHHPPPPDRSRHPHRTLSPGLAVPRRAGGLVVRGGCGHLPLYSHGGGAVVH